MAITSISGPKQGRNFNVPQFYSKNDPEKPPHQVWGFFTFQCFLFFLTFAFSCLIFSSFPLLLGFLKPKSGPSNEVIGYMPYRELAQFEDFVMEIPSAFGLLERQKKTPKALLGALFKHSAALMWPKAHLHGALFGSLFGPRPLGTPVNGRQDHNSGNRSLESPDRNPVSKKLARWATSTRYLTSKTLSNFELRIWLASQHHIHHVMLKMFVFKAKDFM